ncbi:pentapeptide repeat-containing protein [Mycobacteroides franklinii]|uniref:Pentapeptide repeat-containing protein n=1 Tax=Mycobacteroides franklinii TaxID=948102 RepID=A0A4R5P612_9MYCO|nr:pentapeptide repeat-containing protein [Mycobacteroides franklinii]ORA62080.1 hypothetical protein BST24_07995 [Mycobacteroides franklinii]TDH18883.1 pentapeptide repeat-containing protein [Mycobacteroides franklinii]
MDWLTQPVATLFAGLTVAVAAIITFVSSALVRRQTGEHFTTQHAANRQDNQHERYTTAATQLGADTSAAIRLAGVFALLALADDWITQSKNREGQMVADLLRSYLRVRPDDLSYDAAETEVRKTIVLELAERSTWWTDRLERSEEFDIPAPVPDEGQPARALLRRLPVWIGRFLPWWPTSLARQRSPDLTFPAPPKWTSPSGRPQWDHWIDTHLYRVYLAKVDLTRAQLSGVNFSRANLAEVILRQADLELANFSKSVLIKADLAHVYARRSTFEMADLRGADLRWATLLEVVLDNANLAGADLRGALLRGASLDNTNLTGASIEGHDPAWLEAEGAVLNDPDWAAQFTEHPESTPHVSNLHEGRQNWPERSIASQVED